MAFILQEKIFDMCFFVCKLFKVDVTFIRYGECLRYSVALMSAAQNLDIWAIKAVLAKLSVSFICILSIPMSSRGYSRVRAGTVWTAATPRSTRAT